MAHEVVGALAPIRIAFVVASAVVQLEHSGTPSLSYPQYTYTWIVFGTVTAHYKNN